MTDDILNMSKEELISKIEEADLHGKALGVMISEQFELYNNLLAEEDRILAGIEKSKLVIKDLAKARIQMSRVLEAKYGIKMSYDK